MVAAVTKRTLPTVRPEQEGLGMPTIMEPALAARHGAAYVHLAAFAIDVDRIRLHLEAHHPEAEPPFGWEVFLTEVYMLRSFDAASARAQALLEDACLSVLEMGTVPDGEPPLGSQLPFAVYDAVRRGALPDALGHMFGAWRRPPDELVEGLAPLWAEAQDHAPSLAAMCLEVPVEPPLPPPTVQALEELAQLG
jgi:hypothetical protein